MTQMGVRSVATFSLLIQNPKLRLAVKVYTYNPSFGWKRDMSVCNNVSLTSFNRTSLLHLKKPIEIYIADKRDLISRQLVKHKIFDRVDFDVMYKLFNDPKYDFIDIGANLGIHTLKFAEVGKKVFGIETAKDLVQRMCASTVFNNFEDSISIVNNAIGADHNKVRFIQTNSNFGFNFVESNHTKKVMYGTFGKKMFNGSISEYNTIRLDDLLELPPFKGVKHVFIKMDVEGFEHKVIEGSDQFFKHINVAGIYMEWDKQGGHASGDFIISKMKARGYNAFSCNAKKCSLLDDKRVRRYHYNIVWLPRKTIPY